MKSKENRSAPPWFVAFSPQASMKGGVKPDAKPFVDCMDCRVLYFEHQKRGGGSSVFET
ncbi:hypothetical protein H4S14_002900 [Agrobacterium vitis]|nr:hypothetical protein [Agrobacterium vitis]MBE1439138.1 hypothetical protein [Agrobacterium vitis]